ncbi:hypothetical protein GDO81_003958 [Engystomops pustulosus]|uniref:Uncharacterized protein n=1 Tax=Engystomops pustulosus TaxID=76066 RepID=A0AAV7A099_ENGPU|nr:hypothetical protein GDO81_003958 [Engystomops pustulosus]
MSWCLFVRRWLLNRFEDSFSNPKLFSLQLSLPFSHSVGGNKALRRNLLPELKEYEKCAVYAGVTGVVVCLRIGMVGPSVWFPTKI